MAKGIARQLIARVLDKPSLHMAAGIRAVTAMGAGKLGSLLAYPSAMYSISAVQEKVGRKVMTPRWPCRFACLTAVLATALPSWLRVEAGVVTWDVDPAESFIRLTIPDQTVPVPDVGNVTFRIRDASNNSAWTDAGGRRAALDGEIVTEYADAASISFRGGAHNLYAVEAASLRPNPADWDAATTNYTGTGSALAALGGRVRATLFITFDTAFLAFRNVHLDITNAAPGAIALADGAFGPNTTRIGIARAWADLDGLALPFGLGQPIPDLLHAEMAPMIVPNAAGGTITALDGLRRKLTYAINLPDLAIDLDGTVVWGSAAGLVVAYATVPAPPPPTLSASRQDGEIVLAWPSHAAGFALEYATELPPVRWREAALPPTVNHDQFVVTNATSGPAVFYRLRGP